MATFKCPSKILIIVWVYILCRYINYQINFQNYKIYALSFVYWLSIKIHRMTSSSARMFITSSDWSFWMDLDEF